METAYAATITDAEFILHIFILKTVQYLVRSTYILNEFINQALETEYCKYKYN